MRIEVPQIFLQICFISAIFVFDYVSCIIMYSVFLFFYLLYNFLIFQKKRLYFCFLIHLTVATLNLLFASKIIVSVTFVTFQLISTFTFFLILNVDFRKRFSQKDWDNFYKNNEKELLSYFNQEPNCSICLGDYLDEIQTFCGHSFCKNCIKDWMKIQSTCPDCREKIRW